MKVRQAILCTALACVAVRAAGEDAAPVVGALRLDGVTRYDAPTVERVVRLHPGDRLWRAPEDVATALEERYHVQGYVAARVAGRYEAESQTLVLTVDEGRLAEVALPQLSAAAAAAARRVLRLEPGAVVRHRDLLDALDRLETALGGALRGSGDPPYAIERTAGGVRVSFRLEERTTRLALRPDGPGASTLYDRVDGLTPLLGATVHHRDLARYDDLALYARGGYGFASHDLRYALGLRRTFGRVTAGYEFHDLADSDDVFRATALEEALGTLLAKSSFRDYFERRGHEAYVAMRPSGRLEFAVSGRSDRDESLAVREDWSLFRSDAAVRPNPAVTVGRLRAGIVSGRWATSPLEDDEDARGDAFPLRDLYQSRGPEAAWLAAGSYEIGSVDDGRADRSFRRLIASVRHDRPTGAGTSLRARLLVGAGSGALPAQKAFALGGLGTLRGYRFKEMIGNDLALVSAEWSYEPRAPWPAVVAFYDGGAVWSNGSSGRGWVQDLGVGVAVGVRGRALLRVDGALALDRAPGDDRFRLTARIGRAF